MTTARPGCIDVHYHIFPPQVLASTPRVAAMLGSLMDLSDWTPQKALDAMERDGVHCSILSFPIPAFFGDGVADQRALAIACNDYYADLVRNFPGHFGLFAGLPPLTDIDGALAEIARAYDQLAADGVRVMSVYQDLWLGDPTFDPIWAELDRRDAVVFVHPDQPCGCATMPSYAAIELPFDTARTVESLWRFDVSRRFPRIKFILSHGGGALPMIAGRLIDRIELPHEASVSTASEGIGYFRRFYFDTANAATPPALNATLALAASDRVLFGSDYPFVSVGRQIEHLRNSGLPTHELHAILGGNAGKLIPRLCGHHNN